MSGQFLRTFTSFSLLKLLRAANFARNRMETRAFLSRCARANLAREVDEADENREELRRENVEGTDTVYRFLSESERLRLKCRVAGASLALPNAVSFDLCRLSTHASIYTAAYRYQLIGAFCKHST